MDFLKILAPIEWAVAWIMYLAHSGLTSLGLDPASGLAWGLSIVVLVIVIRILLIPLFVKQIKASRGMQLLAPEMQAIQKKYKGKTDQASREAQTRETMALYKKHGTNPFASCLPILAQSPIFFALFRVLNFLDDIGDGTHDPIGPIGQEVAQQAERSTLLGAPLSATFMQAAAEGAAADNTRIVTILLIIAMSATTFLTQRQLTMKNMPPSALQGPMAQQQKVLLYVLPLIFAFTGVNFPIGVLIYWTTTNIWSMLQQFVVIRNNPTPGSEADRKLQERRARKGKPVAAPATTADPEVPAPPRGQRQQPVGKTRAKGKTAPPARPAGPRPATSGTAEKPAGSATGPAGKGTGSGKPGAPGKPAAQKPGGQKPGAGGSGARTGGGKSGTARPSSRGSGSTAVGPGGARPGRAGDAPTERSRKRSGESGGGPASSPSKPIH